MYYILMFSGGKDSTAMLVKGIEKNLPINEVICVDTTKEFPEMYSHIKKIKKFCRTKKIKFTQLKIKFDYYMFDHIKTKGKNKGKIGYGWPDFRNRWCTALKRQVAKKYIKSLQKEHIVEYHGISIEETNRFNKNKDGRIIKYPLKDWNMTGKDCIEYCYGQGYDWGGLYEKFHRVSCWCCPLSRIGELKTIHDDYFDLWGSLKKMDKKSYRRFKPDYSLRKLNHRFKKEKSIEKRNP